jgi:hypothetical protein
MRLRWWRGKGMIKKTSEKDIEQKYFPYLYEIVERLQTGHASVMVGAGFSKNAEGSEKTKAFLSWNELGDKFFDKLNEGCISKKKKEFLNPLKLASEVEAAFGRPTLNNIIRSNIPDNEFQPSELHKKLLSLPWTDVFTTNYDTLLERAAENILQYRYEPVINKEDLIWSTKPRIIKLHGSFPSERPFIITEEDYRTYPSNYAPFVNTVQQSLLENTLCLIGFSGDDPNFLNWIGWIRDNLGTENSPKMYLIGILALSNGQRKLLEDRNIIPIDISFYASDHYNALLLFLDFLIKNCQHEKKKNWLINEENIHFDSASSDFESQTKKLIDTWEKTRKEYPNWLIMPNSRRELLRLNTMSNSIISHIEKIKKPFNIIIIYEFNWRMEKSLHPLLSDWARIYRSIVDTYNPYPDKMEISDSLTPNEHKHMDWEKIGFCWIEIYLSLLSYYRQEGMHEDWELLSKRIEAIKNILIPEQNAKFHYERCLKQLFSLDISALRKEIKLWESNLSLPYWEAKKAGLIAEIYDLDEAQSILEVSLKQVRNKLFLNPVKDDYYDISQEAYILQLLDYVQNSIQFSKSIYSEGNEREEYNKRWRQIKEYECDPWGEIEEYESSFKIKPPPYKKIEKEYGFNIGQVTTHTKFGNDEYTIKAYSFLKYMEETGIPFRLPIITFGSDTACRALERIADYSPEWALITFIRAGNDKDIDTLFSRKALSKIDQEYADKLSILFLDKLKNIIVEFKDGDSFLNRNFAVNLAIILPQILARLCVKNSYEIKLKVLAFIKDVYSSEKRGNYNKISILTENLVKSFSNKEQQKLFSTFMEFPIIPDTHICKYPDPFIYIDIENINIVEDHINIDQLNKLLSTNFNTENTDDQSNISSIRKKYITRLVVLWRYGQLNDEQTDAFASLLWAKKKQNGFPADADYYEFAFLWFPYPKEIKPTPFQLFEKYISQSDSWFKSTSHLKNGIEMTRGYSTVISNFLGTYNKNLSYQWNTNNINNLLLQVLHWWDNDKKRLIEHEEEPYLSSIANEFKARFSKMISLFMCIFAPNIGLIDEKYFGLIDTLLKELPDYTMNNLAARASFLKIFPSNENDIISDIEKVLLSQDEEKMLDALDAIIVLLRQGNKSLESLISMIFQKIKYRSEKCLNHILDNATIIVKLYQKYLDKSVINDINIGLKYLLDELKIDDEDDMEHIHKKLYCRIESIKLLLAFKKYCIANNIEIPIYMSKWEDCCLNKNEFSEIRNTWINNV